MRQRLKNLTQYDRIEASFDGIETWSPNQQQLNTINAYHDDEDSDEDDGNEILDSSSTLPPMSQDDDENDKRSIHFCVVSVIQWVLPFLILWLLTILCVPSALDITSVMQAVSKATVAICLCGLFALRGDSSSTAPKSNVMGAWTLLGICFLLLWKPTLYIDSYFLIKPNISRLERIVHQLEHQGAVPTKGMSHRDRHRPLQALGMGNGHLRELGRALSLHFDRYSRNETEKFEFVETLNLIANVFDDNGVEALVGALEHPASYTRSLLIGRNENIGDGMATKLANLISSQVNTTVSPLLWLEIGSTAVTALK